MTKSRPFGPLWFILFALAGLWAVIGVSRLTAAKEIVPWRDDFAAAQAEARQTGKPMFLYFTAAWCGPCQQMKRTTWTDGDVEAALREYVPTRVDIDRRTDLAMQYQVESVPQFVVVDGDGAVVKRNSEGALPPEDFLGWLTR